MMIFMDNLLIVRLPIQRDQRYDNYNHLELSQSPQPELLCAILQRNPQVFRQQQQQQQQVQPSHHHQQQQQQHHIQQQHHHQINQQQQPWNSNQQAMPQQFQQQPQQVQYNPQQQQQLMGYASPAAHVGPYTPSATAIQVVTRQLFIVFAHLSTILLSDRYPRAMLRSRVPRRRYRPKQSL